MCNQEDIAYIDMLTEVGRKKNISANKQCRRVVCVPVFFNMTGDGRMLRG